MKASANHPEYVPTKITCSCGTIYDTFSTRTDFQVEVCSACHPYYTGKQKIVDAAGRVDRFNKKYNRKPADTDAAPDTDVAAGS